MTKKERDERLYHRLPRAGRVLELGCGDGTFGEHYKHARPATEWIGLEEDPSQIRRARARLDKALLLDPAARDLSVANHIDLIILRDGLERLEQPLALLTALRRRNPAAVLFCCAASLSHISVIEQLLTGDITHDAAGGLAGGRQHLFTQSSLFKLLLDAGWLPTLMHDNPPADPRAELHAALISAAATLGIPEETARRFYAMGDMIVRCLPAQDTNLVAKRETSLSVVVPVNNPLQFRLNILASPGLKEIDAQIIEVKGAASAADGFDKGLAQARGEWILYAHQDVYFPSGSGRRLLTLLSQIPENEAPSEIVGFCGIAAEGGEQGTNVVKLKSGQVIDRDVFQDFGASAQGISLDEFAVILHRDTPYRLDPELGWHLWATDLCLHSMLRSPARKFAKIIRVPVYHNSFNDWTLRQSYVDSAVKLLAKYSEMNAIATICGNLTRQGLEWKPPRPGPADGSS